MIRYEKINYDELKSIALSGGSDEEKEVPNDKGFISLVSCLTFAITASIIRACNKVNHEE